MFTNTYLHKDGPAWLHRAVDVAPSAFLASTSATVDFIQIILPVSLQSLPLCSLTVVTGQSNTPCEGTGAHIKKCWDHQRMCTTADMLLANAPDDLARACLLTASTKESGVWLHALPISSQG